MRRPNIDNVEIVEPPIEELTKQHSGFRRTCFTGCGCVVLFLVGAVVVIWIALGAGPKILKTLPANFPADIPLYDHDNVERITYVSGQYKNRGLKIAAFFPKIILSPLLLQTPNENGGAANLPPTTRADYVKRLWELVTAPNENKRDSVQIEWRELDAEPGFIISYYKKELRKAGYTIDAITEPTKEKISFTKLGGVEGTLFVVGSGDTRRAGTDYAVLTVNVPTDGAP